MNDPATSIAVDRARRSLSVPKRLMPALLALHTGEQLRATQTTAELEAGGLLARGTLDPLVATLLGVMTNPSLVVTVESAGARSLRLATIWGSHRRAVIGTTADQDQFELLQIDPELLPFHLAQITELSPRPAPPFHGAVSLPRATLQRVENLVPGNQRTAERELRQAGIADPWPDWILTALAHRRALWTIEAIWLDGTDRQANRITVLDAGAAGYWTVREDSAGTTVALAAIDFDRLFHRCCKMLPGQ
jgi:hypothetical protein